MKGIIAIVSAAAAIGLAPPAHAAPTVDPLDFTYVIYLSNHGITVPDSMIGEAGNFARRICAMAAIGAPLSEIDTLVHSHYNNVGPTQTIAIEMGAAQFYCPPGSQTTQSYSSPVV